MQLVKKVEEMVKDLVIMLPAMTFIPDVEGNYPLHIAINHKHSHKIIYWIYRACREVGEIEDVKTNLLPFMLAAVGDWINEKDQITIVYQLIREMPPLISVNGNVSKGCSMK